jgi:hypothetical protein
VFLNPLCLLSNYRFFHFLYNLYSTSLIVIFIFEYFWIFFKLLLVIQLFSTCHWNIKFIWLTNFTVSFVSLYVELTFSVVLSSPMLFFNLQQVVTSLVYPVQWWGWHKKCSFLVFSFFNSGFRFWFFRLQFSKCMCQHMCLCYHVNRDINITIAVICYFPTLQLEDILHILKSSIFCICLNA